MVRSPIVGLLPLKLSRFLPTACYNQFFPLGRVIQAKNMALDTI